ncbi:phosphoenolpyruvate synthase [Sphingomonas cannabina]|uniref:phosphoenolpyruvate synthase n=1 Tax=Sphingomonas cannabina TaxID=2899123 RepID=UPI001F35854C|nr:phosphoenolpyruvate synthase [Sphingomonas cannabina]UIJ46226.1 phosphoenolpyruvate synthase [Sphingomonas cannabina]
MRADDLIAWFDTIGRDDVPRVGGKNASLGEMINALGAHGVRVPGGFATTAHAYRSLVTECGIGDPLAEAIRAFRSGDRSLEETGEAIRRLFLDATLPPALAESVVAAYRALSRRAGKREAAVAVRSSATAEDLPDASFAGQQETFLNIVGERALLDACRRCFASLFTDRAIAYREAKGFDHLQVALSIGIQLMVRSDLAGSGVMFSLDPESGFPRVAVISAAWGLGEPVVQGTVDPDNYMVFKPLLCDGRLRPILEKRVGEKACKLVYASGGSARTALVDTSRDERSRFVLDDEEILQLARWAAVIEDHYGVPMDMEWAKDGETGQLFLVQARPETVHANAAPATLKAWRLDTTAAAIVTGSAVGEAIASGPARIVRSAADLPDFPKGAILVAETTDPDWGPVMRKAAGIVTDHGGPTSHAAIVARELGVPAVVGTGDATRQIADGTQVTISCAEGDRGHVYSGALPFHSDEVDLGSLPKTRTELMVNLASPAAAFRWWRLPAKGVGLARMEFIVSNLIRIHPMALVHPEQVTDLNARRIIDDCTSGYSDKRDYFIDVLAQGIARIAAAYHPQPVIVRLSDFKSNEYAHLIGGADFEPYEANPMLGFRGASRYYHERYREGFALECRALRRVRETIGLDNVIVMVPFCRTIAEADLVLAEMSRHGLARGDHGLQIYMMCEIPSNVVLAEEFAARFDGFSIGSNDLTQLLLGIDRDSELLAPSFDARDPAVTRTIADFIRRAHACGAKVGICGQAPSDHPDFARFLVEHGIDSISLNPDSFVSTLRRLAEAEASVAEAAE